MLKSSDGEKASTEHVTPGGLTAEIDRRVGGGRRQAERALVRKQDRRIIPLCVIVYLLCYLDRSNIGNARTLNGDTGDDLLSALRMTQYQYIICLMTFLVSYAVFEVPSNYFLKKTSPSTWIAFLMVSFGALTMGMGGSRNFATVAAVRFLLGAFEAGVFPGLVYYVTFWYKADERSTRVALFFASATLAGAFGGAIAFGIGHMNQVCGLEGWRWLFILEGIPSVLAGVAVYFWMPNYPETVSWLSPEEKALAQERLGGGASKSSDEGITWANAKETLTEGRLWVHYLVFFMASPPFSSLSLFTPTITAGLGFENLEAQLMTVPPYAAAYIAMLVTSYIADKHNMRGLVASGSGLVGGVGYLASALLPADAYSGRYGCLIVAACGTFSCVPPLLGWLSGNVFSAGTAGLAIALNISVAAPGQITGVWIYKPEEAEIGYPTGHGVNAACLFALSIIAPGLVLYYRRLNARILRSADIGERLYVY